MKLIFIILTLIVCSVSVTNAQKAITLDDVSEIRRLVTRDIKSFQNLLNKITLKSNLQAVLTESIRLSYEGNPERDRIFYDKSVRVEDDISPESDIKQNSSDSLRTYIDRFSADYEKSDEYNIDFPEKSITFSDIYRDKYMYLIARYKSIWGGYYRKNHQKYPVRQREVEVKIEPLDRTHWKVLITEVRFVDPAALPDSMTEIVPIKPDSSSVNYLTPSEAAAAMEQRSQKDEILAEKKQALALQCLTQAKTYVENDDIENALREIARADTLSPYDREIYKEKQLINKLYTENTFDNLKRRGDDAKGMHDYPEAVRCYRKAVKRKPESDLERTEVARILQKQDTISLCNNKLENNESDATIKLCEKILNATERNQKVEYPELYYIEACAWEHQLANKQNDNGIRKHIISSLDSAIRYFPKYIKAHSERAAFLLQHTVKRADSIDVISDYDALTHFLPDDSPEKLTFFIKKARLKAQLKNYDGAVGEISQAIVLHKNNDSLYAEKGHLLYLNNRDNDARQALDSAINLNINSGLYRYNRGLILVRLQDYNAAGIDFADAEKLGIKPAQSAVIDSIYNSYLFAGKSLLASNNPVDAEIQFKAAHGLLPNKAESCFGLGQAKFAMAERQKTRSEQARSNYLQAIAFYDMALDRNSRLAEVLMWKGIAECKIDQADSSMKSFNASLLINSKNAETYIARGILKAKEHDYSGAINDDQQALQLLIADENVAKMRGESDREKTLKARKLDVYQLLGESEYYATQFVNAMASLSIAKGPDKNNAGAFYYLGLVNLSTGNKSTAIDNFEAAIKIKKESRYYFDYGRALFADNNNKKALANFKMAVENDSLQTLQSGYHWIGLCIFKMDVKNIIEVLQAYDIYLKAPEARKDGQFLMDLAMAQLYNGQNQLASENITEALKLSPLDPLIKYSQGCFYAKTGQHDLALQCFKQVFTSNHLAEDDISFYEDLFLSEFLKNHDLRSQYKKLKKP